MGFSVEFLGVNLDHKSLNRYDDGSLFYANSTPDMTASCLVDNLMERWLNFFDPYGEKRLFSARSSLRERLVLSLIKNGVFESLEDSVLPHFVFVRFFEASPEMTENVLAVFRNAV